MRNKKLVAIPLCVALTAGVMLAAVGCGENHTPSKDTPPLTVTKIADFKDGASNLFESSSGWSNGSPFNVTWKDSNVSFADEELRLTLTEDEGTYYAGEYRSKVHYGYGHYSVSMKPVKEVGVATAFFTYTGPTDNNNPHDEIDIEFLGKDTTKVQFNYYTNGKGGNEYLYNLGFDAAEEFHEYGFSWAEDKIVWYVDGKPVYQVTKNIPTTPGKIMLNSWCGDSKAENWMGKYAGVTDKSVARYKWVGCSAESTDPLPEPVPDGEITGDPLELTFVPSDDKYVLTPATGATTQVRVVYEGITCTYANVNTDITTVASGMNAVKFKIKNNGETTPTVRVNVNDTSITPDYETIKTMAINTAATKDGVPVSTDVEWGGSYFYDIAAGEEFTAIVYFSGTANSLEFMLDSTHQGVTTGFSGDVTISDIIFGTV